MHKAGRKPERLQKNNWLRGSITLEAAAPAIGERAGYVRERGSVRPAHIAKTQTTLLSQRIEAVRLRQACPQNLLTAENAQT